MNAKQWQFWVDRGGTFTDVVARHPEGQLTSHKYLSENPERYEDAAVFAMREIMEVPKKNPFPSDQVACIKMGTTVATNALLEREGEPTLLLITKGFKDALLIGQQHRADLFALNPTRPQPLYSHVVETEERVDAHGEIITELDETSVRISLQAAYSKGMRSVAIVFMHGYRFPGHEKAAAKIASDMGFTQVSTSHQVSQLMKLVSRGDTTVADAYLSPILRHYVSKVKKAVGDTPLYFMQSNGGLAAADSFEGKDAVLSGPAGGIVGAAKSGERANEKHLLGFDMGGTSTDVSHYAGEYERVLDTVVAGVRMTVPMMDIHTVAAGGGSICQFSQGRFLVGPASAGANPGPAAYGRGGPITVTDCNVAIGKLQPDLFPNVFGKDGKQPLDTAAARSGLKAIAKQIKTETGQELTIENVAEGFLAVAVEHMARAIKKVSVERGHDIKNHALLSFGGAGGQHACLVASALGIDTVVIPPFSGVLSALGMGLASQTTITERALECLLTKEATLNSAVEELTKAVSNKLAAQGVPKKTQSHRLTIHAKYEGSDSTLAVPFGNHGDMQAAFETAHKQQFGFLDKDRAIIAQALEAEASGGESTSALNIRASGNCTTALAERQVYMCGKERETSIFHKESLQPHHPVSGPAIILENGGTTIVEPNWTATLEENDTLKLTKTGESKKQHQVSDTPDPILLEIFNNLFMSVAEEMGGVLAKTAQSVNVKERLDFSCAVFDKTGNLIANAPHMPVHLGSMGESVIAILRARAGTIKPGDVFMVNDPYAGGTHLPDITVITPVFLDDARKHPSFFVASRGHHADIGGISPGSMPPNSQTIQEEGIRFTNFELVKEGDFQEATTKEALASGSYPARNIEQNLADLKAQIAANTKGMSQVIALVKNFGEDVVDNYMGHVQNNAEEAVRRVIADLKDGDYSYPMDCGGTINVSITADKSTRSAIVDFTGTSKQLDGNFNAPLAVTKAAVLYVFRTLTGADIPLNAGCLKPIKLIVPQGSMLNPISPAAVVAGNVETSQAVTNALFLATNAVAASQGTMNNFTFGNDTYQYYETIAGGTGAGQGFGGTAAIQSHMTNSRLTDPEVLEWRYPVRLLEFSVRENSGGKGKFTGGNGARRIIEFMEPMEASILSSHRIKGAPGLNGGDPGEIGSTIVHRRDGTTVTFNASDSAALEAGDIIEINTPGGGGYGSY
ncbi:hydantoinase B/oxoprolinase family protein [Kordiimonas laminariae]|uniref:hydantoinase B/oxoprolinase family protein n=1 Tax=Kordiimonas laminariae TaxID=2917717 RepID=UPI001FF27B76|nr:hydantoinase B/oxoprolinase family protein [Kordiimonas laminariae]MCK0068694.1 hydantoinase B/oxoprolinase family protein [Kordiimonas laminariae]